jgi:dimethylargininase
MQVICGECKGMNKFGSHSMYAPLKRVLMHAPEACIAAADLQLWHYPEVVDLARARDEHAEFVELLQEHDIIVEELTVKQSQNCDSVFTHDASMVTRNGAVLSSMGKVLRRGEEVTHEKYYLEQQIPILGRIVFPAQLEAGDTVWLDERTLCVGRSYRTNQAGIEQLAALLTPLNIELLIFDLPSHYGPQACLHLMSILSVLDRDLALVYEPAAPVALLQELTHRGIKVISAPTQEFHASHTISANVLAIAPRLCVAMRGFPATAAALRQHGCELLLTQSEELGLKMEGGPTCLTRPIWRA